MSRSAADSNGFQISKIYTARGVSDRFHASCSIVSSNTQDGLAIHSRVVAPTRNPQLGGTINGKCTVQRVLVMPVCAGIRVLGSKIEKNAVGARPSTRHRGTNSSSV